MKVTIPQELKGDVPSTPFGKILSATPVVMAVVATMLAGLASSEMTRAQYDRSLGAQQQSKAGDQWSFFQAKRLRGALQQNTADLLQNTTPLRPLLADQIKTMAEQFPPALRTALSQWLDSAPGQQALNFLRNGQVPPLPEAAPQDPRVKAALDGLENLSPDPEMAALLAPVSNQMLDDALAAGRDRSQAFDRATSPVNRSIDQLDKLLGKALDLSRTNSATAAPDTAQGSPAAALNRDFTAARLRYAAQRYEVEARLNQAIANLYELQVRKSNLSAERHHRRSQRFFFGMLGAQLGVIIATFSLAARNRSLLWSLAAGAGLLAIAFAIYVYLYV